jgi:hypothetical protein
MTAVLVVVFLAGASTGALLVSVLVGGARDGR